MPFWVGECLFRPRMSWLNRVLCASVILLNVAEQAKAHREDYLSETLVYLTLHRHELEPEYWFDLGRTGDGWPGFLRHHLAAEYGLTEHWMVDARATLEAAQSERSRLGGARLETRYRFSEEGRLPVDIAVSGEINTQRTARGAQIPGAELRLILSKDLRRSNFTLNLAEEFPFHSEGPSFAPAFGYRFDASRFLYAGSEVKYDVESRRGAVVPQVWFLLPHRATLKAGYSAGFGHGAKSFARIAIEIDF